MASPPQFNEDDFITITVSSSAAGPGMFNADVRQVRRLTRFSGSSTDTVLLVGVDTTNAAATDARMISMIASQTYTMAQTDNFAGTGGAIGAVLPTETWGLEGNANIPEIDIKVDSVVRYRGHQEAQGQVDPGVRTRS